MPNVTEPVPLPDPLVEFFEELESFECLSDVDYFPLPSDDSDDSVPF